MSMERTTKYQPTRVSHPVESLVEFLAMYPGVPINEPFWRKRIDDYVASVVVPPVMRSLPLTKDDMWKAFKHGVEMAVEDRVLFDNWFYENYERQ